MRCGARFFSSDFGQSNIGKRRDKSIGIAGVFHKCDWVQHILDCLGSIRLFDSRLRILCCRGGFHCGFPPSGFRVSGGFGCARIWSAHRRGKPVGNPFLDCFRASRPGQGLSTAFPHLCFSGSSGALRFWFFGALQAWKAMGNPPPVRFLVPGSGLGLPTLSTLSARRRRFGTATFELHHQIFQLFFFKGDDHRPGAFRRPSGLLRARGIRGIGGA